MQHSIIKRLTGAILIISLLLSVPANAFAIDNSTAQYEAVNENMAAYINAKKFQELLEPQSYSYTAFVDNCYSNKTALVTMELVDQLVDTGSVLTIEKEKYMETLIAIINLSDHNQAFDVAAQMKEDNLKSLKDYTMDIVQMSVNIVSIYAGSNASRVIDGLSAAADGLNLLAENTNNWIDALSNLETFLVNYEKYDAFLAAVAEKSDGNLKAAALTLQSSLADARNIKLAAYKDVNEKNFQNYTAFFFDDLFFDVVKQTPNYAEDENLRFFVDYASDYAANYSFLTASWDLGKQIGKLIGNLSVGGENLINRVRELKSLSDIHLALSSKMMDDIDAFLSAYSGKKFDEAAQYVYSYAILSDYLMQCDLRGEYCLYSIVVTDAKLLSWFNRKNSQEMEAWYQSRCAVISAAQAKAAALLNTGDYAVFRDMSDKSFRFYGDLFQDIRTDINIADDGTFTGRYGFDIDDDGKHDYSKTKYWQKYGDNTFEFHGKFSTARKLDDYTYSVKLEYLLIDRPDAVLDVMHQSDYHDMTPYGFEDGDEFLLYLPGTPIEYLPDGFLQWYRLCAYMNNKTLLHYGLYNTNSQAVFFTNHFDDGNKSAKEIDAGDTLFLRGDLAQETLSDGKKIFTLELDEYDLLQCALFSESEQRYVPQEVSKVQIIFPDGGEFVLKNDLLGWQTIKGKVLYINHGSQLAPIVLTDAEVFYKQPWEDDNSCYAWMENI